VPIDRVTGVHLIKAGHFGLVVDDVTVLHDLRGQVVAVLARAARVALGIRQQEVKVGFVRALGLARVIVPLVQRVVGVTIDFLAESLVRTGLTRCKRVAFFIMVVRIQRRAGSICRDRAVVNVGQLVGTFQTEVDGAIHRGRRLYFLFTAFVGQSVDLHVVGHFHVGGDGEANLPAREVVPILAVLGEAAVFAVGHFFAIDLYKVLVVLVVFEVVGVSGERHFDAHRTAHVSVIRDRGLAEGGFIGLGGAIHVQNHGGIAVGVEDVFAVAAIDIV